MNNKALILCFLLLGCAFASAQGHGRDRIKTLKVAFITEHVDITSDEAQKFWPIYNEHEEIMENIRKRERDELFSKISKANDLSKVDSEKLLVNIISIQSEKHKAEQNYLSELRKIISAKKVLLLIKTEQDFKKQLLIQFRKRRNND